MTKIKLFGLLILISLNLSFSFLFSACKQQAQEIEKPQTENNINSKTTIDRENKTANNVENKVTTLPKVADFFPLIKNQLKKFAGKGNEYASFTSVVELVTDDTMQVRQNNGGTESVLVYKVTNGAVTLVYQQGEAYEKGDYTKKRNRNEIILKEPLSVGTKWTLEDGSERSITDINKHLTTEFGVFDAIEITTKSKDSINTEYFAKGMGIIKKIFKAKDNSYEVSSEISSISKKAE